MESNEDDVLPPLPLVVEDALALGYDVIVYVIDDEEGHRYWCANTRQYVEAANVPEAGFKLCEGEEWDSAMCKALEEIQGGPLSSIEEIEAEEYHKKERKRYQSMIPGMIHQSQTTLFQKIQLVIAVG